MNLPNSKRVKLYEYEFHRTIGLGSYSRVRLAKHGQYEKWFAVKIMKKADMIKMKQVDHVVNENNILASINHPFINKYEGFAQDDRYLYFFLEFIQGGELFSLIRSKKYLKTNDSAFYAAQIIIMFEYLHSKNIIYRSFPALKTEI